MKRPNVERSRHLRKESTSPEQILWRQLKNRQIGNVKFRRQHPIGPYITDFCSLEQKLVIEIDGDTHAYKKQQRHDQTRTQLLEQKGLRVIRFTNSDIMNDIEGVIDRVLDVLRSPSS